MARPPKATLLAAAATALAAFAGGMPGPAAAQGVYYDRNQAHDRCYRDAARRFGPPPRQEPRPGEDLVELARRRQNYDDQYSRFVSTCIFEAEQRLRNKPAR